MQLIGNFASLHVLAIPSILMHKDTVHFFTLLPLLKVLKLMSHRVAYSEWRDKEPECDDWTSMGLTTIGFMALQDLCFEEIAPDQLGELVGPGCLPAIRALMIRGQMTCGTLDGYLQAFRILGCLCKQVEHLHLWLPSLNSKRLDAAAWGVWPSAEIEMGECDFTSIYDWI